MLVVLLRNIFRFVLLLLLQVFILNNIQFSGTVNPFAYIFIILALPLETPRWLQLVLAFVAGLSIDVFTRTPGMHVAATVFIAHIRPWALRILAPRDGYEFGARPRMGDMGFTWSLSYIALLTFIHHLVLFFLESFGFAHFGTTIMTVFGSTIFTIAIVLLIELFALRAKASTY